MRRYETIMILKPSLGEEENTVVLDRATGIIEDGGGALIKTDKWGLKTLAYLIQKELQGYYIYIQYSGTPEAVAEMERIFRIDDRVMKYLTVKIQDVYSHMPEDDVAESEPAETSTEKAPAAPAATAAKEEAPAETPKNDDTADAVEEVTEEVAEKPAEEPAEEAAEEPSEKDEE